MNEPGCRNSHCLQLQVFFAEQQKDRQSHPNVAKIETELSVRAALVMNETDVLVSSAVELHIAVHTALDAMTHLMLCCAVLKS